MNKYIPDTKFLRSRWGIAILVASAIWLIFSVLSPARDYFGAYTWMVMKPQMLPEVANFTWTLNPPWMIPFMAPFITLPGQAGMILFLGAMLAMTLYGVYIFGGKPLPAILSNQMFWILWWGQLEGWGVLGFVLAWLALQGGSWGLMFLGLIFASFKPQVSLIPVLALWWWSGPQRWKSMAGLFLVFLLSLVVWGPWPLWYLEGILKFVGDKHFGPWNASIGWIALPLFIPALWIPLERKTRLLALTATTLLVSPYMPYYSTILLFCFDLPWWAYIFAFSGYLTPILGPVIGWNSVVLLPISVLAWLYYPFIKNRLARRSI